MSETPDPTTSTSPGAQPSADAPKKRAGGLNGMLLAELKAMAVQLGVPGAAGMRKAQLVEAIKAGQGGGAAKREPAAQPAPADRETRPADEEGERRSSGPVVVTTRRERTRTRQQGDAASQDRSPGGSTGAEAGRQDERQREDRPQDSRQDSRQGDRQDGRRKADAQDEAQTEQQGEKQPDKRGRDKRAGDKQAGDKQAGEKQGGGAEGRNRDKQENRDRQSGPQENRDRQSGPQENRDRQGGQPAKQDRRARQEAEEQDERDLDEEGGSRRNRRRRGRERQPVSRGGRNEPDTTILEDDVLVPAAGILDVLENYAFVRTSGYLPGTDDVYLSLSMVRKYGLRRGDAIVGQVRQPREGERREKFNPMVRIDTVNGTDPEASRDRPEFDAFTPVHPTERLRLETGPDNLVGRMVDLTAPVGKGQRGLVVAPPEAGRTSVLRAISSSISANNPECHLMVVLVDERPEEVTDFQRTVKGEVIASTFDRPAADHTMLAELAIERAKRLVELGHDVVVLLDSLTRLARAYDATAPANGRTLAGGVDAGALHPPKKFFGAARNVEDGGSLTILATAVVESGSRTDEVIFEEFQGTASSTLRLRRELAEKGAFPAIDPIRSGTRHEEQLMGGEELAIVRKLRRALVEMEDQRAYELVQERLRASQSNIELLTWVQKAGPELGTGS